MESKAITMGDLNGFQKVLPVVEYALKFWGSRALEILFNVKSGPGEKEIKSGIIFRVCCEHYELTADDVLTRQNTTGRITDRTRALSAICYFHRKYLKYSQSAIGKVIGGKSKSYANKQIKYVNNLSPSIPDDQFALQDIKAMEQKIEKLFQELKHE